MQDEQSGQPFQNKMKIIYTHSNAYHHPFSLPYGQKEIHTVPESQTAKIRLKTPGRPW
jgi:hypothetical protein